MNQLSYLLSGALPIVSKSSVLLPVALFVCRPDWPQEQDCRGLTSHEPVGGNEGGRDEGRKRLKPWIDLPAC